MPYLAVGFESLKWENCCLSEGQPKGKCREQVVECLEERLSLKETDLLKIQFYFLDDSSATIGFSGDFSEGQEHYHDACSYFAGRVQFSFPDGDTSSVFNSLF